ncbi:MAG: hypothetical protein AAFN18_21995 [Cyanobacteria bacterium J06554_6]
MVKTSRQIQQAIEQLQQQTTELGDELESLYEDYFKTLGEASQRQLVLAAYHLCTQVYPESFLKLSYSHREKLQKTLQQLGSQIHEQLLEKWQRAKRVSRQSSQSDGLSLIKQLFLQAETAQALSRQTTAGGDRQPPTEADHSDSHPDSSAAAPTAASPESPESATPHPPKDADAETSANNALLDRLEGELDSWLNESIDPREPSESGEEGVPADDRDLRRPLRYRVLKVQEGDDGTDISFLDGGELGTDDPAAIRAKILEQRLGEDASTTAAATGEEDSTEAGSEEEAAPLEPTHLLRLQLLMEKSIRDILKTVSETANYLLQQAQIVPEMPKALLAAAAESDGLSQTPMKTPNLLKISVKILHGVDDDEDEDDDSMDQGDDRSSELEETLGRHLEQALRQRLADGSDASGRPNNSEDPGDYSDEAPSRQPRILQIESLPEFVVIHLRLSEVEFADPYAASQRRQIRAKMNDLKKLGRTYKKAQRKLAIAQAEDAWRASWIE